MLVIQYLYTTIIAPPPLCVNIYITFYIAMCLIDQAADQQPGAIGRTAPVAGRNKNIFFIFFIFPILINHRNLGGFCSAYRTTVFDNHIKKKLPVAIRLRTFFCVSIVAEGIQGFNFLQFKMFLKC